MTLWSVKSIIEAKSQQSKKMTWLRFSSSKLKRIISGALSLFSRCLIYKVHSSLCFEVSLSATACLVQHTQRSLSSTFFSNFLKAFRFRFCCIPVFGLLSRALCQYTKSVAKCQAFFANFFAFFREQTLWFGFLPILPSFPHFCND